MLLVKSSWALVLLALGVDEQLSSSAIPVQYLAQRKREIIQPVTVGSSWMGQVVQATINSNFSGETGECCTQVSFTSVIDLRESEIMRPMRSSPTQPFCFLIRCMYRRHCRFVWRRDVQFSFATLFSFAMAFSFVTAFSFALVTSVMTSAVSLLVIGVGDLESCLVGSG